MVTDSAHPWRVLAFFGVLVAMTGGNAWAGCPMHDQCPPPSDNAPVSSTSGNSDLDSRMNGEYRWLCLTFGVTPCIFIYGEADSLNASAFPDSGRYVIKFGRRLLADFMEDLELIDQAVAGIMAHEFAHVVQEKRGTALRAKYRELHADFLAGYYLKLRKRSLEAVEPLARKFFRYGMRADADTRNTWFFPDAQGDPEERLRALLAGLGYSELSFEEAYRSAERKYVDEQFKGH